MKKLITLILIVFIAFSGIVFASDLFSGDISLRSMYSKGMENHLPVVTSNLNLDISHGNWTSGFYFDLDINTNLSNSNLSINVGEVYIDYYGDDFEITAGRQRITWGTALNFNPTDNLNPQSPGGLFAEKKPVMMLNGKYYINRTYHAEIAAIPFHVPSMKVIQLPNDMTLEPEQVAPEFSNMEFAVKFAGRGVSGFDFSLSYFRGFEDTPWVNYKQTPQGPVPEDAYYRRYSVLGFDMATTIYDAGLWLEGAYMIPENGDNYYGIVIGSDYKLSNNLYIEGQLIHQKNQMQFSNTLLQASLEKPFADIHKTSLGFVFNPEMGGFLISPEVEFSLADATTLQARFQYKHGELFKNGAQNMMIPDGWQLEANLKYAF
ncbi:MAG: hypothetical protein FXF54_14845 [Kosmotoga sp.]|nr:MAG: hypothetical protein FXF54_14845 [Kosmotoga sp.]